MIQYLLKQDEQTTQLLRQNQGRRLAEYAPHASWVIIEQAESGKAKQKWGRSGFFLLSSFWRASWGPFLGYYLLGAWGEPQVLGVRVYVATWLAVVSITLYFSLSSDLRDYLSGWDALKPFEHSPLMRGWITWPQAQTWARMMLLIFIVCAMSLILAADFTFWLLACLAAALSWTWMRGWWKSYPFNEWVLFFLYGPLLSFGLVSLWQMKDLVAVGLVGIGLGLYQMLRYLSERWNFFIFESHYKWASTFSYLGFARAKRYHFIVWIIYAAWFVGLQWYWGGGLMIVPSLVLVAFLFWSMSRAFSQFVTPMGGALRRWQKQITQAMNYPMMLLVAEASVYWLAR